MTPREFGLLAKRQQELVEHGELQTGIIASVTANFSMGAPKVPLKPYDFVSSAVAKKAIQSKRKRKPKIDKFRNVESGKDLMSYLKGKGLKEGGTPIHVDRKFRPK